MTTVTDIRPRLCGDSDHDDRWCNTCECMWDGVYMALDFVEEHYGHGRTLEDGFVPWVKAKTSDEDAETGATICSVCRRRIETGERIDP